MTPRGSQNVSRPKVARLTTACSLAVLVASCGSASTSGQTGSSPAPSASTAAASSIVNTWVGPPADTTALPIGTSKVSLTGAKAGGLYACNAGNPNGGGAEVVGAWVNQAKGTWDLSKKVAVQGSVSWPMASYSETLTGTTRDITSNGLPLTQVTGTFPIATDDPAYQYDRNANHIAAKETTISLPLRPTESSAPTCLSGGSVGILKNGVALFASLDERNRDAVVYETQDVCDGHPQQMGVYHYHEIPSCIRDAAAGSSTVVGFANDGFPIAVERDAAGQLPTNADLDQCHGRTSPIELDGTVVEMYHYSATYEFPYFIGCYRGTPTGSSGGPPPGGQQAGGVSIATIAAQLGVTEHELADAMATGDVNTAAALLGTTPEAMAKKLGVSVAVIQAFIHPRPAGAPTSFPAN